MQPKLSLLALALWLACSPALSAQQSANAPVETPEIRAAQLDSMAQKLDTALSTLTTQAATRGDEYHSDKVFAHYFSEASLDNLAVLRNELEGESSRIENRFYLSAGKIFCWSLLREEKSKDSPRARKRLTRYYCENGVIFHVIEKSVPAQESLENQEFVVVPVAEAKAMTEFMNRKFQHLLDAFQQGWKVNAGN